MITQTLFRARHYAGDTDLQAVCDLLNLCDAVGKLEDNYSLEDLRIELSSPDFDTERDLRVWHDSEDRLVAFGQMWVPKGGKDLDGYLYWRVHPEARHSGIEENLFSWAQERMLEVGRERGMAAKIRATARDFDAYSRSVVEAHGMEPVRYWFRMARPLDEPVPEAQFPEGYTLRHTSEEDLEAWVECYNQSFIDHWTHHPLTIENHKHWLTDSKYRPDLDLVAIAPDGTIAAFCFCLIDPDSNKRNNRSEGWIDMLGTRRSHRKIGLGTAMLLAGMSKLKAEGIEQAMLGVDAENPSGALRMYEAVGFKTVITSVTYNKDL